ncbi:alpha/beta fold hydrolase [Paramicrobacterium fandaimingii]|uniref:alpha/beta fold hydrolase n=1 Tax=Paramicrobacterium fandaimingii TaxID=2708079 RepID=UPI0014231DDE|nr:alpha/beta fold hydrolase [Microbacterium fandaimingii]
MTTPTIAVTEPVGPDGAPFILLGPSLGTSTILWEQVVPQLAQKYRVAAWDLPGHGAAPVPSEGFTVADLADAVATAAHELGVQKLHYAGISLGGAVGIELLLRHPDLVVSAAIICSAAKIGETDAWHERAAQVRGMGTGTLIVPSAGRWFAPGSMEREPHLTGRLLHALRDADDGAYAFCCDALAAFDARDALADIAAPVLALWGEHDAVVSEGEASQLADGVANGRTMRIDGAAHLPAAEQPAALSRALLDFFDERTPR